MRLIKKHFIPFQLTIQYRMHPALAEFPSNMFYKGNIRNGVTAKDRTRPSKDFPWRDWKNPMVFIDVDGMEERTPVDLSWQNKLEALYVNNVLMTFRNNGIMGLKIGVITPYQSQKSMINSFTQSAFDPQLQEWYNDVTVSTVDGYQGAERDYIILSCVRNNDRDQIGFVEDLRRMNVSITRARFGLIIIGSAAVLRKHDGWRELIDHFTKKGLVVRGSDLYPAPSPDNIVCNTDN